MKRFGPFTAEGGLVLGLIAVIAGGTFVVDSIAPETKPQVRTIYGTPTVRVHNVGTGGIQPGAVQPRAIIPAAVVAAPGAAGVPVVTAAPVATAAPKKKKKKVETPTTPVTAEPAVTAEPDPTDPGAGTGTGTGGTKEPCLLGPLCPPVAAPKQPKDTPAEPATATKGDAPNVEAAKNEPPAANADAAEPKKP